jgi:hypothetical protein
MLMSFMPWVRGIVGSRGDKDPADITAAPTIYRDFLYLDDEQTIDNIAALQGGDANQVMRELVSQRSLEAGFGAKSSSPLPLEANLGGKRSKQVTERVLLKRNLHAAIKELLIALERTGQMTGLEKVRSGNIVGLQGEGVLLPIGPPLDGGLRMSKPHARSFWQGLVGWFRPHRAELERADRYLERGVGERFLMLFVPDEDEQGGDKTVVILDCERDWLRLEPDEIEQLTGPLMLVGKVLRVGDEDGLALFESRGERMTLRLLSANSGPLPERGQLLKRLDGRLKLSPTGDLTSALAATRSARRGEQ